jgi:hypothetical protein
MSAAGKRLSSKKDFPSQKVSSKAARRQRSASGEYETLHEGGGQVGELET